MRENGNPSWCVEADPKLVARFRDYHEKNPKVWKDFLDKARLIKHTHRRDRYSAWWIINAIRWETDTATTGDVFKINNDFIALYARAAEFADKSLENLFEKREMKPERRLISREQRRREGEEESK